MCVVYCVLVWVLQHITQKQQAQMIRNTHTCPRSKGEKKRRELNASRGVEGRSDRYIDRGSREWKDA